MRVCIGEACGPIDSLLLHTTFGVKKIGVTIYPPPGSTRLMIEVDDADEVRARALLAEIRSQDHWTHKELEATGYYDDDYPRCY